MFSFFDSIFASKRSLDIVASKFNHCSTVCPFPTGSLVAWYSGLGECRDDQSVHLVFIGREKSEITRIGDKTGNPVLWRTSENTATLLYSRFDDTGIIRRIVDRWKFCSLWIQQVQIDNGIQLVGTPQKVIEPDENLLARCNPLRTSKELGDKLLLPLYNEVTGTCVIAEVIGEQLDILGEYGKNIIQPTLWQEEGVIHSLGRNFGTYRKHSVHHQSFDGGTSWSDPVRSYIPNNNSSIHVAKLKDEHFAIWNDTTGRRRSHLKLGKLTWEEGEVVAEGWHLLEPQNGSYPSMASIGDKLVFSYSHNGTIRYHEWNRRAIRRRDPS